MPLLPYSGKALADIWPIQLTNAGRPTEPSGLNGLALSNTVPPPVHFTNCYNNLTAYASELIFQGSSACPALTYTSGGSSAVAQQAGFASDGYGNVFVANSNANTGTFYTLGARGDAAPIRVWI